MGIKQYRSAIAFFAIIGLSAIGHAWLWIKLVRSSRDRLPKKRPLMIFPLLKEMGAGWYNMQAVEAIAID
jgi:hypothetical protein